MKRNLGGRRRATTTTLRTPTTTTATITDVGSRAAKVWRIILSIGLDLVGRPTRRTRAGQYALSGPNWPTLRVTHKTGRQSGRVVLVDAISLPEGRHMHAERQRVRSSGALRELRGPSRAQVEFGALNRAARDGRGN